MKHHYWRVIATLKNGSREWDVTVWSLYRNKKEAKTGADTFVKYTAPKCGYDVMGVRIEPTPESEVNL